MASSSHHLHVFFLPFPSPGHMIPMVDLAVTFARRGVRATIVTTAANAPLIRPTVDGCSPHLPLQLLPLVSPPSPVENAVNLPSPSLTPEFVAFLDSIEAPFGDLLDKRRPDFVVSDALFPWSADFSVKRMVFICTSAFSSVVLPTVSSLDVDDDEPFLVPGIPHCVEMKKSQLMEGGAILAGELSARVLQSFHRTYGTVMNTFSHLEKDYVGLLNGKAWHVGPVSLSCGMTAARGGESRGIDGNKDLYCLEWLDAKETGSVAYVCFGSLSRFTLAQLREMAAGLEAADCPFVWVVAKGWGDKAEWMPEGFEERVSGRGLVMRGWAPQTLILGHPAVGGFVTHCGWNSCLEGVAAGLPMVTWPLFSDQFSNERLLVDVLRIGVAAGVKKASVDAEKRTLVRRGEVKKAVEEVMGSGEEATERKRRAKVLAEKAREAVEEGGSSYNDMSILIQEMAAVKARGAGGGAGEVRVSK